MGGVKLYVGVGVGVLSVSLAAIFIRLADAPPLTVAAYHMCITAIAIGVVVESALRSTYPGPHTRHSLSAVSGLPSHWKGRGSRAFRRLMGVDELS